MARSHNATPAGVAVGFFGDANHPEDMYDTLAFDYAGALAQWEYNRVSRSASWSVQGA